MSLVVARNPAWVWRHFLERFAAAECSEFDELVFIIKAAGVKLLDQTGRVFSQFGCLIRPKTVKDASDGLGYASRIRFLGGIGHRVLLSEFSVAKSYPVWGSSQP